MTHDADSASLNRLPDPRERPWITVAELAVITGEGEKAIRAAIDAGHLPSIRVGRYVRIPTAALLRVLAIEPESTEVEPASSTSATVVALTKNVSGGLDHAPPAS